MLGDYFLIDRFEPVFSYRPDERRDPYALSYHKEVEELKRAMKFQNGVNMIPSDQDVGDDKTTSVIASAFDNIALSVDGS
ncbi:hypothetical protein M8J77_001457 [Diaphorina citri]|nr:hypothetical protein M8J77_001457 [Diaphorina citri]